MTTCQVCHQNSYTVPSIRSRREDESCLACAFGLLALLSLSIGGPHNLQAMRFTAVFALVCMLLAATAMADTVAEVLSRLISFLC
jgi:hypothetical protein